jgi:HSP20 family protein
MIMPVFRFEPAREIENISKKMKNFFNEVPDNFTFEVGAYSPRLDLVEDEAKIYVNVEIPGVTKESVKLSIQDNILTIKGEKKKDLEDEKINYYRNERLFGTFSRSIELPLDVDNNNITAKLDNGVLSIQLIKVQKKATEKNIEIN